MGTNVSMFRRLWCLFKDLLHPITSTKTIWQSLYIHPTPLQQKILKIWSEISYDESITSTENLLSLPLWQNSLVRIGNKPGIFYKSWSSKGIQNVRHLMKDADSLLSFSEFKERVDVKTNFLVYHGVVSCIKLLRNATENQNENNRNFGTFRKLHKSS